MGARFSPILGHLVLSQCWVGAFPEHIDEYWVACVLTDRDRHWGTLIAVFDNPVNEAMVDEVQILSVRLSEILLEGDLMAMNDRSWQ
ncbi:MAG TPA: hypothetical protein QF626_02510 [Prochlorococcaceae cyanobacterium Fu_MAG_50]|nr:hypothetical protein [Prochlorococcaceae cyanobacterium Fu_MAG_50]